MKWKKMGLIFRPDNNYEWMATHAYVPVPHKISDDVLRIYFATRSKAIKSVTTFIDVEADNPSRVIYVHDRPVLDMGTLGTFDDGGAVPFCMLEHDDKLYLYYGGWNASVTVPYRNSIGLAVSEDNGLTFRRVCEGAIVDRNQHEAYFTGACEVLREAGKWRMWYGSATGWVIVNGKPEPCYKIKYGESDDGINWSRPNRTCIEYKFEGEAIARPSIIREDGRYKMWYCSRGSVNYRTDKEQSYRVGYAESVDGLDWERKDEEVGIDRSADGWDSIMMCYPYVYQHKDKKYLFYNGNGFGESGVGYAESC
ncbi:MAG TPA: hypothetical protein VFH46_19545 [Pyrinomonadaceae bacterium]|nr:hypothetical protein [Pyrinomonadaceae bacterium]